MEGMTVKRKHILGIFVATVTAGTIAASVSGASAGEVPGVTSKLPPSECVVTGPPPPGQPPAFHRPGRPDLACTPDTPSLTDLLRRLGFGG
jgi:hypothetical protein